MSDTPGAPGAIAPPRDGSSNRHRFRKFLPASAVLLAAAFLFYGCLMWSIQDAMIFPRDAAQSCGRDLPPNAERRWYSAPDGKKIETWYFKGAGRSAQSPGPLLVCFHGNADLIENESWSAEQWQARGFSVLLPEYRGYGRSEGDPSQDAIVADSVAIARLALERPEVDRAKVILLGRSLGGGVAVQVAKHLPPAAMILQSTFISVASMASRYLVPGWLVKHPFRNDLTLPQLHSPLLLAHGRHDTIIPYSHALQLKKLRPDAELITLDCDHNDFPGPPDQQAKFESAAESFLRTHHLWPAR
jgi:pimeloyl-ACP methyl ester carboxylesterase